MNTEQFTAGRDSVAGVASANSLPQGGKPGENASMANIDTKMNGLFDLGPSGMESIDLDYDLGGDNVDNSNFNEMYFGAGDSSTSRGEFDDAYFNLSG